MSLNDKEKDKQAKSTSVTNSDDEQQDNQSTVLQATTMKDGKCDGYWNLNCWQGFIGFEKKRILPKDSTSEEIPGGPYVSHIGVEVISENRLVFGGITEDRKKLNVYSLQLGEKKPFILVAQLTWKFDLASFNKVDILYCKAPAADQFAAEIYAFSTFEIVQQGRAAGKVLQTYISWKESEGTADIIDIQSEDLDLAIHYVKKQIHMLQFLHRYIITNKASITMRQTKEGFVEATLIKFERKAFLIHL